MREYLFYTLILILLSLVLFIGVYLIYLDNEKINDESFNKNITKIQKNQKIKIFEQEPSNSTIIIIKKKEVEHFWNSQIISKYLYYMYYGNFDKNLCNLIPKINNIYYYIYLITNFLDKNIKYKADFGIDDVSSPKELIKNGFGDCEDHTIFLMSFINYCYKDKNNLDLYLVEGDKHIFSAMCNIDINKYLASMKYLKNNSNHFEIYFDFDKLSLSTWKLYIGKVEIKKDYLLRFSIIDFISIFKKIFGKNIKCKYYSLNVNTNCNYSISKDPYEIKSFNNNYFTDSDMNLYLMIYSNTDKTCNIRADISCYLDSVDLNDLKIHIYDLFGYNKNGKYIELKNCIFLEPTRKLEDKNGYSYDLYPGVSLDTNYLKEKSLKNKDSNCRFVFYNKNDIICINGWKEKNIKVIID